MPHSPSKQAQAYAYAIATVLLWSTVAAAFKLSLRYLDSYQLLLIAAASATLALFLVLLAQGKLAMLFALRRDDYARLFLLGLLNPLGYYLVLFKAYALLPAQVAQALNYTWAITLMLLSIPMLKHAVSGHDVLAALVCYAGVVVICMGGAQFPGGGLDALGIALALGSTIIWALYWLFKTRDALDPVVGLFLSFLFSLPLVFGACVLFSTLPAWSLHGWLGGVYVGLFEMGLTFILWLSALRLSASVAKISTLIYLSPFLSLFFIHYLVDEAIAANTLFGLVLIISGLLLQRGDELGR